MSAQLLSRAISLTLLLAACLPALAAGDRPFPGPSPKLTIEPTPTPTPVPTPCVINTGIPLLRNSDLPYSQTVHTQANQASVFFYNIVEDGFEKDAMWEFFPSVSGDYNIAVTGYDCALGVLTGDCCASYGANATNKTYGPESVVMHFDAGTLYTIAGKGTRSGSFGDLTMKLKGPLVKTANDLWANAAVINPASIPYSVTFNTYKNTDTFTPAAVTDSGGLAGAPDAWWKFTPTATGKYEIRIESVALDVALGVYTGSFPSLTQVGSVDSSYYGDHLVLTLQSGTTYSIIADGAAPAAKGEMTLSIRGPGAPSANSTFATATVVPAGALPFIQDFDTTFNPSAKDGGNSLAEGGGASPDAWWRFTPAQTGRYTIGLKSIDSPELDQTLIDSLLTVYTGPDAAHLTQFVSRDTGTYGEEMTTATLTQGVTYTILTEGFSDIDFGKMRLLVDGPAQAAPNNACANAIDIPAASLPASIYMNTLGSQSLFDSPVVLLKGGTGGGPEVWYTFTPATSGVYALALDLDTGGLALYIDVTLSVFTGSCGAFTQVAGADDYNGAFATPERIAARLNAGTTYHICCEGYDPASAGPMRLTVDGPYLPSANDLCTGPGQNSVRDWSLFR